MKICLVGKFPPIAGGVSTRTYAYAHALAERGHDVHVITNANEVESPFRMLMRDGDWRRCEAVYARGSVRVHWTSPLDDRQFHIPAANPFATKLASLGMDIARKEAVDVVFSFYMEPYAVAGHLIAQASGLPHVVRTAGSDAGRLWQHPQFAPLYDHVLRSATIVIAGGALADAMEKAGVMRQRLRAIGAYRVDDRTFSPDGPMLDVRSVLRAARSDSAFAPLCRGEFRPELRYFGVYGKLGERKGTAPLLHALAAVKARGLDAGLLILGQAVPRSGSACQALAAGLGLDKAIVQLPFLPNWRVPEFIRCCLAVCSLEQDFPIPLHQPIVAREIMACGGCLIASTEMLRKLPFAQRVVHGYNAVGIEDATDVGALADRLAAILARPELVPAVGARARRLTRDYQRDVAFPAALEHALAEAVRCGASTARSGSRRPVRRRMRQRAAPRTPTAPRATASSPRDPLFRLSTAAWALDPATLGKLVPEPAPGLEIAIARASPADMTFTGEGKASATAVIDARTASALALCDGSRSLAEIARMMAARRPRESHPPDTVYSCVLTLFELGALALKERRATRPGSAARHAQVRPGGTGGTGRRSDGTGGVRR